MILNLCGSFISGNTGDARLGMGLEPEGVQGQYLFSWIAIKKAKGLLRGVGSSIAGSSYRTTGA